MTASGAEHESTERDATAKHHSRLSSEQKIPKSATSRRRALQRLAPHCVTKLEKCPRTFGRNALQLLSVQLRLIPSAKAVVYFHFNFKRQTPCDWYADLWCGISAHVSAVQQSAGTIVEWKGTVLHHGRRAVIRLYSFRHFQTLSDCRQRLEQGHTLLSKDFNDPVARFGCGPNSRIPFLILPFD
ncbi:hypothetical protein KIN20_013270 [Parelaphostrongylus tenuis]|uniref:Uncharacterized protein n=1 Tax=Parelaphostrongylus tenuis TaxID=148309 RepID=A0AAD5MX68_PARTN|nr:hypothetical protein KIN20_013270 [Parelaphostrongylus tenuis]